MKVLMTNGNGFVASHLMRALVGAGHEVHAWYIDQSAPRPQPASWYEVDVTQAQAVQESIAAVKPDCVVHLAAISHVPTSFSDPVKTWQVNTLGSLNVLQSLVESQIEPKVVLIGSSDCYGDSFKSGQPLSEDDLLLPLNPYAASKAATDLMAYQFARSKGQKILRLRPFNHVGPGQSSAFVVPSFAQQIARIEAGEQSSTMEVGNLEAERDFLDVRDVIAAYQQLIELPVEAFDGRAVNVCSGRRRRISDVLDSLLSLSRCDIKLVQSPERMRPSDIPAALGNNAVLKSMTSWEPSVPWETTLSDTLDYWRVQQG